MMKRFICLPFTMALLIVFIAGSAFAGNYSLIYYDGHMHTLRSDGSGTVAQIKEIAVGRGLDAVIITDHCKDLTLGEWRSLVAESKALSDSTLLIVPAFEVTGSDGIFNRAHVNALGVDDPFVGSDRCELCPEEVWPIPPNPEGTGAKPSVNITKWANYIHLYGGIAVHNHPSGTTSLDYRVDNLEIYNQGHVDDVASYAKLLGFTDPEALAFGLVLNDFSLYGERDLYLPVTLPGYPTMPLRLALYYATLSLTGVGQWLGAPEAPPLNSWDELLMAYVDHVVYKPIYGLANSDSHTTSNPADSTIGSARNGAFVTIGKYGLTTKELLKAIKAGHTFGTTGPSLNLDVNGKIMGDTAFICNGGTARINLYANSENPYAGLVKIDIYRNGWFWQTIYPGGTEDYATTIEDSDLTEDGYYRVEVTSFDITDGMYKFAWSNPVFIRVFRIGG